MNPSSSLTLASISFKTALDVGVIAPGKSQSQTTFDCSLPHSLLVDKSLTDTVRSPASFNIHLRSILPVEAIKVSPETETEADFNCFLKPKGKVWAQSPFIHKKRQAPNFTYWECFILILCLFICYTIASYSEQSPFPPRNTPCS